MLRGTLVLPSRTLTSPIRRAMASTPISSLLAILQTRQYRIPHMTKSQQDRALADTIALCDYKILRYELNNFSRGSLNRDIANLVTLADFRRNVKDVYESRINRLIKGTRRNKEMSLMCLFLHSLHYACLDRAKYTHSAKYSVERLGGRMEKCIGLKSQEEKRVWIKEMRKQDPELEKKVMQCLSLYMYGDSTLYVNLESTSQCWNNVLVSLAGVLSHFEQHTFHDILVWMSCIMAGTVTESCSALTGQRLLPSFMIKDVLERVPRSDYEVELLVHLYKSSEDQGTYSMAILNNLVHYTKMYRYHDLENLFKAIISKEKSIKGDDLNRLVFLVGERLHKVTAKEYSFSIIRAQKVLIDAINARDEDVKAGGYLGMAMSLSEVSMSRAIQFHERSLEFVETPEEQLMEKRTRLKLSTSENQLKEAFRSVNTGSSTDSQLWADFFQLSQDFGMLIKSKSTDFIQQHKRYSTLHHSRSPLLRSVDPSITLQETTNLDNKSISGLISQLYTCKEPMMNFPSGPDAARHLFQSLSQPTRSIASEVLYGEAHMDPEGAYTRFNRFLYRYCDGIANERCLLSLIIPALTREGLKWENRKAPQLAVHEFRKAVKMSCDETTRLHIASDKLWRSYIRLCGRCDYQYELSEVFEAWESLRFVPEKKTLAMLLGAVADGVGERIRDHGVKYLSPETFDEIETDVWDWPTNRDIAYWRFMLQSKPLDG